MPRRNLGNNSLKPFDSIFCAFNTKLCQLFRFPSEQDISGKLARRFFFSVCASYFTPVDDVHFAFAGLLGDMPEIVK
ncbi:MAG: hypothetical protein A3I14_16295 [Candidatus Rokubacteria bacterium RIFCSPLOWO2_02_FULL_73_56]|nr:MAG: hypothetical protein A3I14_16295 [Candidatus Rokubacteria bacterium RIFCSPLOWO2_02_FULL_73_56]